VYHGPSSGRPLSGLRDITPITSDTNSIALPALTPKPAGACCDSCAHGGGCSDGDGHAHSKPLTRRFQGIPVYGWLGMIGLALAVLSSSHVNAFKE
jgi:hypothetical protein